MWTKTIAWAVCFRHPLPLSVVPSSYLSLRRVSMPSILSTGSSPPATCKPVRTEQ